MIASEAELRTELALALPIDSEPKLSSTEFDTLVFQCRRIDNGHNAPDSYPAWKAATVYASGALVVPDPRNGFVYQSGGGTSAATQPVWPTSLSTTVMDGTVTWTCHAVAPWLGAWDLDSAAEWGWRMKAGKVANVVDAAVRGGQVGATDNRGQFYTHCVSQAETFRRARLVKVGSGLRPYNDPGY